MIFAPLHRPDAYLPLQGSYSDISINSYSTSTNSMSFGTGQFGEANGSASFGAVSGIRIAGLGTELESQDSVGFGMSIYFKLTSLSYLNNKCNIFGRWTGTIYDTPWVRYVTDSERIQIIWYNGTGYDNILLSKTLSTDNWYYLYFYLKDGEQIIQCDNDIASDSQSLSINNQESFMTIGNWGSNNNNFHMQGNIQHFKYHTRKLSESERKFAIINKGRLRA